MSASDLMSFGFSIDFHVNNKFQKTNSAQVLLIKNRVIFKKE